VLDGAAKSFSFKRFFCPTNRLAEFAAICGLSFLIAFVLTGNQIFLANWGVVDDWEIFSWLGTKKSLPFSEIKNTLLTMTEVGAPAHRFRPSYYLLKMVEAATWGSSVHLWYLTRTVEFAVFIASIWWITSRFVGILVGGVLLIPTLVMPFWGDVWGRLGPSEAEGAAALGALLLGAYGLYAGETSRRRTFGAIVVSAATLFLVGAKETFVPFAGLSIPLLVTAYARQKISLIVAALLVAITCVFSVSMIFFVQKAISGGADYYGKPVELTSLLAIAQSSFIRSVVYWAPLYITAILWFALRERSQGQTLRRWASASSATVAVFAFLIVLFVSQCVAYRSELPLNMRYDFPGALFLPMNFCLLSCYVGYMARLQFSGKSIGIFISVIALGYLVIPNASSQFRPLAIPKATIRNIQRTSAFFRELQSMVSAAKESPDRAIILEVYEPWNWSFEPIFSLVAYLSAMDSKNTISVRMHPSDRSSETTDDGLKRRIAALQDQGERAISPLATSLANAKGMCISVGINGPSVPECTEFRISTE